jgi:ATP-binding cassette subfamily B multidrug efflux pump
MIIFWHLRGHFRRYAVRYGVAIALLCVIALLNVLPPLWVGHIVDDIATGTLDRDALMLAVVKLVSAVVLIYVLRNVWRGLLYWASYRLSAALRKQLLADFLRRDPDFFQRHGSGDLLAHATSDVQAVEMAAGEGVLTLVDGVMTGLIVLVCLLMVDVRLTLLVLIPWPVMSYFMWRIGQDLHVAFEASQSRFATLTDHVHDSLGGIRVIRALGLEQARERLFDRAVEDTLNAGLAVANAESRYDPVIQLTVGCSLLLALGFGGFGVMQGEISVGELTRFTLYMGMLLWPMFAYGWLLNIVQRGVIAWERLRALETEPRLAGGHLDIAIDTTRALTLRIGSFTYPGSKTPALTGIHLVVGSGTTLGVVGRSGSGKTTLLDLLAGVYPVHSGDIVWGEADLALLERSCLRRHVTMVPQDPFLFSLSVAENIALGRPDASADEIVRAARLACVHDDIMALSDGYRTLVGERGVMLSGGQKQRVAIARALLMSPDLLLLDDTLSAVDALTEQAIVASLREERRGKTTVIVSHRLSVVQHADHLLVLESGRISESGDHDSLLHAGGWYARMHEYQHWERTVEGAVPSITPKEGTPKEGTPMDAGRKGHP